MESWVGKKLGKVQIESLVGRGGAAEVYLGTHITLDRKVAVKILRNLDDESSDKLDRFRREARVIAKLRHPNIVQVHDFDTLDNYPYLVMEYIDGPSLSKYLNTLHQNQGWLPLSQIVRLIRAIASALQYAHNNGVIHRDVKPGNILLTSPSKLIEIGKPLPEDFEPVLTDFGLVRFLGAHRQTTTGHIAGTPAYMSPEQARGEAVDGRGDIYSLGIVLYEMLAGDVPFDGESTVSILLKQVKDPPTPIPGLSPLIQRVLDRALAKEAKDRFQTPMEFAEALHAALVGRDSPVAAPSGIPLRKIEEPVKVQRPASLNGRWVRIAVLTVIAVAFGGFFFFINGFPSSASGEATATDPAPSATYTISIPSTGTQTATAMVPAGPVGLLHFQNKNAIADQVSFNTQAMNAPQPGSQYEIWLIGADERLSLGTFTPNEKGQSALTYSAPDDTNLLSRYEGLEITIEPDPDTDSAPSGLVVYSFTLPEEELTHVRYLLAAFPKTPDKAGLIPGLYTTAQQVANLAKEIQNASQSSDQKTMRQKAEAALNLLVGHQSPDFKDWDGDGTFNPSKSYGLLVNGGNFGYLQAVQSETNFLLNMQGGTQQRMDSGKAVIACVQNMAQWTPELRNRLLTVLNASPDSSAGESSRDLVTLSEQILSGIDLNQNGKVDPVAGECGAVTAYEQAYHLADMAVLPAGLSDQLTQVANFTPIPTVQGNSGNNPAATGVADPTKAPKATKVSKPTKSSGGNGNGGGNGGNGGGNGNGNGGGNGKKK